MFLVQRLPFEYEGDSGEEHTQKFATLPPETSNENVRPPRPDETDTPGVDLVDGDGENAGGTIYDNRASDVGDGEGNLELGEVDESGLDLSFDTGLVDSPMSETREATDATLGGRGSETGIPHNDPHDSSDTLSLQEGIPLGESEIGRPFPDSGNGDNAPPPPDSGNGDNAPPPPDSGNGDNAPPPHDSGNEDNAPPPPDSDNGDNAPPPPDSGNGDNAPRGTYNQLIITNTIQWRAQEFPGGGAKTHKNISIML